MSFDPRELQRFLSALESQGYVDFRRKNLAENPQKLLLRHSGKPLESLWAVWLASERKLGSKIPKDWFERGWICPSPLSAEQCSPWEISSSIDWGNRGDALDVCAGLGVDSVAMARSGLTVRSIEQNPVLAAALEHNFKILELEIEVVCLPAELYIETLRANSLELLYADPDRRPAGNKVRALEDSRPDPVSYWARWKDISSRIILKISPMFDAHEAIRTLGSEGIEAVEAWSLNAELKELLIRYSSHNHSEAILRACMRRSSGGFRQFEDGLFREDRRLAVQVESIERGMYLADPEAALHKLGMYSKLSEQYPEGRWISANTHLMIFHKPPIDFPGEVFVLERPFDRKTDQNTALDPLLRNYPERAETLRKQHRLLGGSNRRLIGFRNQSLRSELWIARSDF